jgi:hypothetical protein
MEGVGENFGCQRAKLILAPQMVPAVPELDVDLDCVITGDCAGAYQRAAQELHDEASFSNLPQLDQLDQILALGDLEFELEVQEEFMSDGQSANALPRPPWPVLPRSEAIGVTYHKKNEQWEAHLWVRDRQLGKRKKKGTQIFLGNFRTQDEAKAAHDQAAIKLDVRETAKGKPYPLNFPESAQSRVMQEHADWTPRDFVWKIRRFSHKFSKGRSAMKGVSVRSRKGKAACYEAKISQTMGDGEKRTFDLGKHECEEDAGRAYDRALLFLKGGDSDCVTNFRPSGYPVAEIQQVGRRLLRTPS